MTEVQTQRPAHLWVPDFLGAGGIQHYSRALLQAITELMPELQVRVLCKNDREMGPLSGGYPIPEGVAVSTFGKWPPSLRTAAYSLGGLIAAAKERPAWALCTHPNFSKALRYIKPLLGVPYFSVVHGVDTWGQVHGALRAGLMGSERVISVSEFTRRHLIDECGFPPEKVSVVLNTFDESLFQTGPKPQQLLDRHHLTADQPVIVTVGRLSSTEKYKGHEDVFRAMREVLKTCPTARYVVVGDGDDASRLKQVCHDIGVADAVIFAGYVPRDELPLYYRLSDVFAMPSTGEGFGIVFVEALASGRPVIAANADASPEAIDGGRLGWLVDPARPDQIAKAAIGIFEKKVRPELADQEWLRAEAIRLFGYTAFKKSVKNLLDTSGIKPS